MYKQEKTGNNMTREIRGISLDNEKFHDIINA